jgi:hypothetical protein
MSVDRDRQMIIREVNDRIREVNAGFGVTAGTCTVLCECGAPGCLEPVVVPVGADSVNFVAPGHAPDAAAA